jgi:3-dehydroquinate synthase
VVAEDEFDHGKRQLLNLGHTIGHGVETHSQFSVSHGNAVAIGMAIIARSAEKMGLCSNDTCHNIISLLKDFGLPVSTGYSADALFECALSDKKRSGSKVNLIIPTKIGECRIYPTLIEELKSFIQAGL